MYLHEFASLRPAWLGDADPCLMTTLEVVQAGDLGALIAALAQHRDAHAADKVAHYYATRDLRPDGLDPVARAARFIYLSKTGFNGLRRYSKSGRYNVPIGSFENPSICEPDVLRWNRTRLQGVELRRGDIATTIADAMAGDFYYLDPPYVEVSKTSSFVGYTPTGFTLEDHKRVASCFRWLTMRGAKCMLTNSDTPRSRELYAGFRIESYGATRSLNSKRGSRGRVSEIVVLNY